MKHFTKAQQDLEDKREFLLLNIVKLKHINKRRIIELKKQNKNLNRIVNEILVSDGERLDLLSFTLNNMLNNKGGGKIK